METIWTWLNGKKTIIGAVALVAAAILEQIVIGQFHITAAWIPEVVKVLQYVGGVFGAVGLSHKALK